MSAKMKFDKFLGKVRESDETVVVSGSDGNSTAANITVNDVSPDDAGNIQLKAEDISFNLKDSLGYDIPTAPAIGNMNLQEFFVTMQYAIFSVNGHSAYIDPDNPEQIITDITIYGNTMFLETPENETPMIDWDGNPLSQKTVYELAYDVYTYCPKGIVINDGEMASTDGEGVLYLRIGIEDVIVREEWNDDMQDYYKYYLTDTLYEVNYLKMGVPNYSESSINLGYSPFTEEMAPATGWVFVEVNLNGESFKTYVTVNGIQILNIGYVGSSMNERGSFFFPVFEGDTFYIGEEGGEQDGSYSIKFITNIPLYNI